MPAKINIVCTTMYAIYCAKCHGLLQSPHGSMYAHQDVDVLTKTYEHLCKVRRTRLILCQKCTPDKNNRDTPAADDVQGETPCLPG